MEILVMGTAAAEGLPASYCDCPTCTGARRRGGPNLRTRAGTLIDDDLKIDHGPDTVVHMQRAGRSLATVRAIVITHNHPDHLYAMDLKRVAAPSTTTRLETPIAVYGPEPVLEAIRQANMPEAARRQLDLRRLEPLVPATTEMDDTILPLPARHEPGSVILRITRGTRTVLYGHDSGLYLPETLAALGDGVRLDVALMDCTLAGAKSANQHHLNIEGLLQMVGELRQRGAIHSGTRVIATHFSHNGRMLHEELVATLLPHGIEVAYDGLRLSI